MPVCKRDPFIYILLLIALILRIPAVSESLSAVYNSTEYFLAKIALNMGSRHSLDPLVYVYPAFYFYILLGLYGGYYLVGRAIGSFPDQASFAVKFLTEPASFYLLGRLLSTGLSLLSIYFMYRILEKYRGKIFARLAAGMAALSQYYIEFSGYATMDMVLIFFATLTVLFFFIIEDSPRLLFLFLQGLCCGLAIAAKYNAGFLVIGILLADYYLYRKYNLNYYKATLLSTAGIVSGFFLTNPLGLITPLTYYQGFLYRTSQMGIAVSTDHGLDYIWEISHLFSTEWMIGFTFIAGTIFVIWKHPRFYRPQLAAVLLTFLYVGSWQKKGLDYLFAIFPIWIIFGTVWVEHSYLNIFKKDLYKKVFITVIFLPSCLLSLYHGVLWLNQDTREQATEWLIAHHQPGQKYCYDNHHYDLAVFDIDRYLEYGAGAVFLPQAVRQKLEHYRPDMRNISFIPIMYGYQDRVYSTTDSYAKDESFFKRKDLERLIGEGTDFLITNEDFYSTYQQVTLEQYPPVIAGRIREVRDFYFLLERRYEPVKIFEAGFWSKGPCLKIYDLNRTGSHGTGNR
jgi:hypothetical protein